MVHGFTGAIWWAVGILVVASAVVSFVMINTTAEQVNLAVAGGAEDGESEDRVPVIMH